MKSKCLAGLNASTLKLLQLDRKLHRVKVRANSLRRYKTFMLGVEVSNSWVP